MKKYIFINSLLLTCLYANQSDFNSFNDLLKEMELTTQIATKNKVAPMYAPGIITILQGDDLKRMGIKDFYDALRLIPSIDIDISSSGTKNIITRGVGGIVGSGKTKIMINGIGQNIDASGLFHINLPIDLIKRIEVIRGPASALYGEYAFSGVINIITKNTNTVFYEKSTHGYTTGTNLSYKKNDLSITVNLSYVDDEGINPQATNTLNITKEVGTSRESQNFISTIKYKDFTANIALNKAKKDEFYGLLSTIPADDGKKHFSYDYKNIELSNRFTINDKFSLEPKIGYFNYKYWMDSTFPVAKANNTYNKKYYMIDSFYSLNTHQLISGFEYSKTDEEDSNINKRVLNAVYIQDNIKLTDKLTANFGLRYETYDDKANSKLGNTILPRVATVYNYDDVNIYKFQYSKGYRAPTFLEDMYTSLLPENIYTYELQHIYNKRNYKLQTTLFYSIIEDLISKNSGNYINENDSIISRGVEFEYKIDYNDILFNYNISYTDAYKKATKEDLKNYSKILSNVSLSYLPYSKFSTTINGRYIGAKSRDILDGRDKLKAQSIFDIVFKYLPKNNIEVLFGVKNIFDNIIYSPSNTPKTIVVPFPAPGYTISTLNDDFIESQRESFVKVTYKF